MLSPFYVQHCAELILNNRNLFSVGFLYTHYKGVSAFYFIVNAFNKIYSITACYKKLLPRLTFNTLLILRPYLSVI